MQHVFPPTQNSPCGVILFLFSLIKPLCHSIIPAIYQGSTVASKNVHQWLTLFVCVCVLNDSEPWESTLCVFLCLREPWVVCSADRQTDTHTQHPLLLFDPMHSWITLCAGFSSLILMSTLTINHMLMETLGESQWFSSRFSSIRFSFCSSSSFNIL